MADNFRTMNAEGCSYYGVISCALHAQDIGVPPEHRANATRTLSWRDYIGKTELHYFHFITT